MHRLKLVAIAVLDVCGIVAGCPLVAPYAVCGDCDSGMPPVLIGDVCSVGVVRFVELYGVLQVVDYPHRVILRWVGEDVELHESWSGWLRVVESGYV